MRYDNRMRPDGTTECVPVSPRFIVNDTPYFITQAWLEDIMQAWERSPFPPLKPYVLTVDGLEHARQQALKENLRAKWITAA